jgi:hypothetical protein
MNPAVILHIALLQYSLARKIENRLIVFIQKNHKSPLEILPLYLTSSDYSFWTI